MNKKVELLDQYEEKQEQPQVIYVPTENSFETIINKIIWGIILIVVVIAAIGFLKTLF